MQTLTENRIDIPLTDKHAIQSSNNENGTLAKANLMD